MNGPLTSTAHAAAHPAPRFRIARVVAGQLTSQFWSVTFLLFGGLGFYAAFALTPHASDGLVPHWVRIAASALFGGSFALSAHILGASSHLHPRSRSQILLKIALSCGAATLVVVTFCSLVLYQPIGRYIFLIGSLLTSTAAFGGRLILWTFSNKARPVVCILGTEAFCESTVRFLASQPRAVKTVSWTLDESVPCRPKSIIHWLYTCGADEVVYQPACWDYLEETAIRALGEGFPIAPISAYSELHYQKMITGALPTASLASTHFAHSWPAFLIAKRIADIAFALAGIVLSAPIVLLAALLIRLEDGGPIFYSQVRVGRYGRPFRIFKLRSMAIDSEKHGVQWASKNDDRVTRIGNLIRRTRIDELPQFINILLGTMSFVGPRPERPELIEDLKKQINHYELRHLLKPGLTGWAQINYPYGSTVQDACEKLAYDLYYVKHARLALDLQIALRTIGAAMQGAR